MGEFVSEAQAREEVTRMDSNLKLLENKIHKKAQWKKHALTKADKASKMREFKTPESDNDIMNYI